jgi:hypothetical protein
MFDELLEIARETIISEFTDSPTRVQQDKRTNLEGEMHLAPRSLETEGNWGREGREVKAGPCWAQFLRGESKGTLLPETAFFLLISDQELRFSFSVVGYDTIRKVVLYHVRVCNKNFGEHLCTCYLRYSALREFHIKFKVL